MNAEITNIDLDVNLAVTLITMVTLATAFVVGLATMPRPSRATIAWALAFGVGMLGTYAFVAAAMLQSVPLRALSSGLMLSFVPLLWLGLRLHIQRRVPWLATIAWAVFVPLAAPFLVMLPYFPGVFRVLFFGAGVFAGLIAYDLMTMQIHNRDVVLPLVFASCVFVLLAVVFVVDGFIASAVRGGDELGLMRDINGVGTLVVSQCAAITIVLLVRTERRQSRGGAGASANQIVTRLARAEAHGETAWSLLDIRLDDQADLRLAVGQAGFARILDAFHVNVAGALPAAVDVQRVDQARVVALIPGSDQFVRHHLRVLLDRISATDETETGAVVTRASASVGWAAVADVGYDYQTLLASAEKGAENAEALGGDRWEHCTRVTTTLEG